MLEVIAELTVLLIAVLVFTPAFVAAVIELETVLDTSAPLVMAELTVELIAVVVFAPAVMAESIDVVTV